MIFWIAAGVFIIDRFTKAIAINSIFLGQSIKIIPKIFYLTLVLNNGTAFGLFKGWRIVFILFSAAVIASIIVYTLKHKDIDKISSVILGLILGGASGNLVDRVWFGRVIDFFDFRIWPVFNVADSCITIGVTILMWRILIKKSKLKS